MDACQAVRAASDRAVVDYRVLVSLGAGDEGVCRSQVNDLDFRRVDDLRVVRKFGDPSLLVRRQEDFTHELGGGQCVVGALLLAFRD